MRLSDHPFIFCFVHSLCSAGIPSVAAVISGRSKREALLPKHTGNDVSRTCCPAVTLERQGPVSVFINVGVHGET